MTLVFIIKVEKDEIFIAFPNARGDKNDNIFLTRANGQWVGDCNDKGLVQKIGREIDATYKPKTREKRKPA